MNNDSNKNDHVLKVLTIGESGVGKTCILLRYTDNKFVKNHLTTIGIDYKFKNFNLGDKSVKLKIWDTAGQERFRNITQQYYKNADGILLVYDVSDRTSYEKVRDWMKQIQSATEENKISVILVGNKCDVSNREVTKEEGEELGQEYGLRYFETSAMNNHNIEETFIQLSKDIISIKDSRRESISLESKNKNVNLNDNKMNFDKANPNAKEKKCC
jgi:Ras-related protein Rab-8A